MRLEEQSPVQGRGKGRAVLIAIFANLLPLFLALYGLKCIVMREGKLTEPGQYVMGSFRPEPVHGMAAIMTGLGDIALGIFTYLSAGMRPWEPRNLGYRIVRGIIRWGSLATGFFLWRTAHHLRIGA